MYKPNNDGSDILPDAVKTMCWHYVTITGVYKNTFTGKVCLKVQSWGESYYLDYDQFVDYNDKWGNSGTLFFVNQ